MYFRLIHAGRYTHRERYVQKCQYCYLSLTITGMVYSHLRLPDGRLLGELSSGGLHLVPPGFIIDFEYAAGRENFALALELPGLVKIPNEKHLKIVWDTQSFSVPYSIELPLAQRLLQREYYARVVELFQEATPAAFFAAERLTAHLLGEYVLAASRQTVSAEAHLAERFRRAIDADLTFNVPLEKLAANVGAAIGPARRIFQARYGLSPGEYRVQRRQNRILELLGQTSHTMERISREVGMKNATHLYSFVKRRFGVTPCKLRREFRGG